MAHANAHELTVTPIYEEVAVFELHKQAAFHLSLEYSSTITVTLSDVTIAKVYCAVTKYRSTGTGMVTHSLKLMLQLKAHGQFNRVHQIC